MLKRNIAMLMLELLVLDFLRMHQGGTQEAPRMHSGRSQEEAPRSPQGSREALDTKSITPLNESVKVTKQIKFYYVFSKINITKYCTFQ